MRSLVPDFILLGSLALLVAAPALVAGNVSPAYDGSYTGQAVPAPAMSTPGCASFALAPVTIIKGSIRSGGNGAAMQGYVTEDGFVTGHLSRLGKSNVPIEGRFTGGTFSGGVIDSDGRCAWTVNLTPA